MDKLPTESNPIEEKSRRRVLAIGGIVVVLIVLLVLIAWWQSRRLTRDLAPAVNNNQEALQAFLRAPASPSAADKAALENFLLETGEPPSSVQARTQLKEFIFK